MSAGRRENITPTKIQYDFDELRLRVIKGRSRALTFTEEFMIKSSSKFVLLWALVLTGTLAAGVELESAAWSGDIVPFSAKQFEKSKSEGKRVLLDFHASWCPTCRRQKSSLEEVLKEAEFSQIVALEVNYDDETKLEKELRVSSQSTLILFKGGKEIARSVSVAGRDELRTFLSKANKE